MAVTRLPRFSCLNSGSQDTAFLDGVDDLQNYFGVTFHNNPLVGKFHYLDLSELVQDKPEMRRKCT